MCHRWSRLRHDGQVKHTIETVRIDDRRVTPSPSQDEVVTYVEITSSARVLLAARDREEVLPSRQDDFTPIRIRIRFLDRGTK